MRRMAIQRTRDFDARTSRIRDVGKRRPGAPREHGEVDGCRISGVESHQGTHHRLRPLGVAAEVVAAHEHTSSLPLPRSSASLRTLSMLTPATVETHDRIDT